jgi:hypothetical protein
MAGTISFDKASYNKGDTVSLTVKDPARVVTQTITVPSVSGPIQASLTIDAPAGTPTDTGNHTWKLISDDPTTGTTVWSTTA